MSSDPINMDDVQSSSSPDWSVDGPQEFSVRVHCIEARELKGREDSGISDPICYVRVNNQSQKTPVFKKTLNAVFDHVFFFTLHMTKAEFENCCVQFDVYDANAIRRDVLIGSSAVDLQSVYTAERHELYKQWMALLDTTGTFDGVQGYLQFSCTVAPPGEGLPPPRPADDEEEVDLENVDLASLVMNAPDIHLNEYLLNVTIFEMSDLPKVDALSGTADPYVRVKLGSRSARVQEKRNTLDPRFNEELRVPAALPSLSDRIEILVMDWDRGNADDLICSKYFSFQEVLKKPFGPQWVHFYGAPNGDCSAVGDPYNRGYKEGTVYRGRMYMAMDTKSAVKPKVGKKNVARPSYPPDDEYKLTIDVYEGSEIIQTSNRLTLRFSVGVQRLSDCVSTKCKNGSAHFYEQLDEKVMLPGGIDLTLPDAAPDLLVECFVKQLFGSKRCGYMRLKIADLLSWQCVPRWYDFRPDDYSFKYNESQLPGSVLMGITLGPWDKAPLERPLLNHFERQTFQLRAHIYQCRALPAADDNGLSDPYIVVSCSGESVKSTRKSATVNPSFYETLCVDVDLPVPLEAAAPPINVMVYDWDALSGDDLLGRFRMETHLCSDVMPEQPMWYSLYFDNPKETEGEILVSFQLIPSAKVDALPVESIKPPTRDCYFEINVVGLRDMLPYNMLSVENPVITFDTGDMETRNTTHNEPRVNGNSIDILETVHLSVALPIDDLYAPYINMMVYDQRVLGNVLVGSTSIPIAPYLPWNVKSSAVDMEEAEKNKKLTAVRKNSEVIVDIEEPLMSVDDERTLPEVAAQEIVADVVDDDDDDVNDVDDEDYGSGFGGLHNDYASAAAGGGGGGGGGDDDYGDDDDDDEEQAWPEVGEELENSLADELPFEEFELWRGKARGLNAMQKLTTSSDSGSKKLSGRFKGRFRVIENSRLRYVDDPINLKAVYKAKKMIARVYVYKGMQIVPHDDNGFSDPYIIISCGDHKTTKKEGGLVEKTQEPEFFKCYDVPTTVPGPRLYIQCWDHDLLSADDLIGETVIDLENRYFCPKWKKWDKKPIEYRTLWSDASKSPQGRLKLCIEIMSVKKAGRHPARNIAPPPPKPFELRVVVWETRNVVFADDESSDIFCTAMLEGMKHKERQETDTHWKSDDGTGSFNWRMKFPIMLPYSTPRLKIGIWDKDLVSANDVIAEAILNLTAYFKRAFKTGKGFEFVDKWVECYHPNKPGQVQGEVRLTVELIDQTSADARANGLGRDEPNKYPVLPPPDRPDNSFNPLNPLGWMKLAGGGMFDMGKKVCCVVGVIGIAIVIWQLSAFF